MKEISDDQKRRIACAAANHATANCLPDVHRRERLWHAVFYSVFCSLLFLEHTASGHSLPTPSEN